MICKGFTVLGGIVVAGLLAVSTPAQAETFGFDCITNNLAGDCTIGEAQLQVEVTDAGGGQVSFVFTNAGPLASSITDVYFDDGSLLGIATINDGTGVDFEQNASPGDLPGGNNVDPPFETTAGFSADSEPPAQPNGVNPGESVEIIFDLIGGGTFQDILDELDSGELRIGIHVQGFASGGSESFVNCCGPGEGPGGGGGQTPVPEPSTLLLLGSGLLILTRMTRRFTRKND